MTCSKRIITRSLISLISILILVSFFYWFFNDQIKYPQYSKKTFPIEVTSTIPNFEIKKVNSNKFNYLIDNWKVFEKDNFHLFSLKKNVTVEKLIISLIDQEQSFDKVGDEAGTTLLRSVGESWDENDKTLKLLVYVNPMYYRSSVNAKNISEILNRYILSAIYRRTHLKEILSPGGVQKSVIIGESQVRFLFENNDLPFEIKIKNK